MKTESMINLILGAAVAIGFVWTQLKSLPRLDQKVQDHEVQLAVMRADLSYIKQGVETLITNRRRERREP